MATQFSAIRNQLATVFLERDDTRGQELALLLDLKTSEIQDAPDEWHLTIEDGKLALRQSEANLFTLSFEDIRNRVENASSSAIAKACASARRPKVLDALGGWGLDAIILSEAGCRVTVTEASPIVCAVARNLAREANTPVVFNCGFVEDYLNTSGELFDVVYLDPIFPLHPKGARPSRRMQILQTIAKTDLDLQAVFEIAKKHALNRVVVKHRRNQPALFGVPHWKITSKTVRFDVYRSSA